MVLNVHSGHRCPEAAVPSDRPGVKCSLWNGSGPCRMKMNKAASPKRPNLYDFNVFIAALRLNTRQTSVRGVRFCD